jgi:hypothetical protein
MLCTAGVSFHDHKVLNTPVDLQFYHLVNTPIRVVGSSFFEKFGYDMRIGYYKRILVEHPHRYYRP